MHLKLSPNAKIQLKEIMSALVHCREGSMLHAILFEMTVKQRLSQPKQAGRNYSYILSADLDNETAVSSLLTELRLEVDADDTQYNFASFLALLAVTIK